MNIVDIIILLLIIFGGVLGYKAGVIKKTTSFLGLFIIVIISFSCKNYVSVLLYENLPFFNFFGFVSGIGIINVLFYELVAFLVVFFGLTVILKILITVTGLIEWILKFNVFLSFPSKVLGIFVGILEAYVYIFLVLVILNLPFFNIDIIRESQFANVILNDSPVISPIAKDTVDTYMLVYENIKNKDGKDNETVNEEILDILIEQGVVTEESATKLVNSNKIIVSDDYRLKGNNNTKGDE